MSMILQYARVDQDTVERLRRDPAATAGDLEAELEETDDETRSGDTDKAWAGLLFLMAAHQAPVDVILGGRSLKCDDWGYEPPRILDVGEVARAAAYLRETSFSVLAPFYDASALSRKKIYPEIWDEPFALEYLREAYDDLSAFFDRAARAADSVLLWLA